MNDITDAHRANLATAIKKAVVEGLASVQVRQLSWFYKNYINKDVRRMKLVEKLRASK